MRYALVHAPTLSRLVEDGLILRLSRGFNDRSDADVDFPHSLAEMAKRVPRGESARVHRVL